MLENCSISGPTGTLEASLTTPSATALSVTECTAIAVLCHPHPLYGGSMHDAVLGTLAERLTEAGIAVVRFNFRGVGRSAGSYDGAGGEAADLDAVLDWVKAGYPDLTVLLGGYSFGASVASEHMSNPAISRMLLIAPPLGNLTVAAPDGSRGVDVFAGDSDPFVDLELLKAWQAARIHLIPGADHFFSDRLPELRTAIDESLIDS